MLRIAYMRSSKNNFEDTVGVDTIARTLHNSIEHTWRDLRVHPYLYPPKAQKMNGRRILFLREDYEAWRQGLKQVRKVQSKRGRPRKIDTLKP